MTPPTYCDFYKWLLVEELTLTFPEQFHYGLCSIIGRIRIDPYNSIFLDNIRIPGVDRYVMGSLYTPIAHQSNGIVTFQKIPTGRRGSAIKTFLERL